MELVELRVGQLLEIDKPGPGLRDGAEQLVELQVDGSGIAVLRVLDEEHDEEGDDRRYRC